MNILVRRCRLQSCRHGSFIAPSLRVCRVHNTSAVGNRTGNQWQRKRKLFTFGAIATAGVVGSGLLYLRQQREETGLLNPSSFTPFILIRKERVSDTSCILTLRQAPPSLSSSPTVNPYGHLWRQGIWSVEILQPQLMISRRYTPLPPQTSTEAVEQKGSEYPSDLRLLIRREEYGEVSSYLHSLTEGAAVEVRGGYEDYTLPMDVARVVFLAGGTGVAPALQVAHALEQRSRFLRSGTQADSTGHVDVNILWANRKRVDCLGGTSSPAKHSSSWLERWGQRAPSTDKQNEDEKGTLVKQLAGIEQALSGDDANNLHLKTRYFVDEEGSFINPENITKALASSTVGEPKQVGGRKLILVSGPDGFVACMAGSKTLRTEFAQQGSIGGLLSNVDLRGWEVWKL